MAEITNNIQTQDSLRYSRQSYAVGKDVMTKLSEAKVLVIGYNTLGQEIIKNIVLQGLNQIDICSNKNPLENYQITGLYYPVSNTSIPLEEIRKLNPTIEINQIEHNQILNEEQEFNSEQIKKYNMVIITNCTFEDGLTLNRICHKLSIPFIMTGCYGLTGFVFNDFGENFIVSDVDGEVYENLLIKSIENNLLTFKDKHNLSDRDTLIITTNDNKTHEILVLSTETPFVIKLKNNFELDKGEIKTIIKKKIPQTINFEMLKNNLETITAVLSDYSVDFNRSNDLHELMKAYNKYLEEYGATPKAWSLSEFDVFSSFIKDFNSKTQEFVRLAKKFCFTLRGDVLPFASIIGGVVGHEVIKALGHKYIPITQWYYLDYLELIDNKEIDEYGNETETKSRNYKITNSSNFNRYEGLINVFGKKLLEKIQSTAPFIVGSGAIGCEILKNLGMMGVKIMFISDPDYIEKSNLSRQFLFSDGDIRKSKAQTAANKIKIFNPDSEVLVFENKVCGDTETIFNDDFYSQVDILLNALDNIDARIYMDEQAIKYSIPLIDSGTTGSKGNVQVVIPYLTESYGSSKDPDEKTGIPICTIKSFPYKPEHTIQWARELFETEFGLIPSLIEKYRDIEKLTSTNDGDIKIFYSQIYKYVDFELTPYKYFNLLSTIFYENFYKNCIDLINKYKKPEFVDELGDKILPSILNTTSELPQLYQSFIIYGFEIMNQMFKTDFKYKSSDIFYKQLNPVIFNEGFEGLDNILVDMAFDSIIKIVNKIPKIFKVDFEKDDDSLGHVQFVTECANLRNEQYQIPKQDIYETRKIAGNIIPAMITTTSLISGFQILEYIKIIKYYSPNKHVSIDADSDIDIYKNRFVNLNTNYIDGINPVKPERQILNNKSISIWTKITVNSTNTCDVIEQINNFTQNTVEFMTMGTETVYDGDDIFIHSIDFDLKVLALVIIDDKPIELKITLKFN
jgi:ubiquitin-activating enzyme E1